MVTGDPKYVYKKYAAAPLESAAPIENPELRSSTAGVSVNTQALNTQYKDIPLPQAFAEPKDLANGNEITIVVLASIVILLVAVVACLLCNRTKKLKLAESIEEGAPGAI